MTIHGVKMTKDIESMKVLYEKGEKFYIRSGRDDFEVGKPLKDSYNSLFTQWGFRKMEEPVPIFRDREELVDGVKRFEMKPDGRVSYTAHSF